QFLLISCSIILVCVTAIGIISRTVLEREIYGQYQEKATILLYAMKAVRQHFRTVVRPEATRLMGEERFLTPLQSTSFAARGVFQKIPYEYRSDISFRIASTKPLNSNNLATPIEADLIRILDKKHQQGEPLEWRGIRDVGGVDNFIIAIGEVNQPSCISCHSDKSAAPEELQDAYAFDAQPRLVDRVESAEIVSIPMSSMAYMIAKADNVMILLAGVGIVLIISAMYFSFSTLIRRPITTLQDHASAIAKGDLEHRLDTEFRGEFQQLKLAMESMVGSLRDKIIQASEQQAAILVQQTQLKTVINSSGDLIFFKDNELRYIIANKAHEPIFGIPAEEMIGKTDHELMPGDLADSCKVSDQEALEIGVAVTEEQIEDRWFHVVKRRVVDSQGNPTGIVGVIQDTTARRNAEALILEKATAEASGKAKGEFLAVMSHEIRTPMNVLLGMIELLEGTETSQEQHRYLASARRSGEHLLELINDILDFSKIEAGEVELHPAPFALEGLVRDVAEAARVGALGKRLTLATKIDVDTSFLRLGDAPKLMQVLMNLVSNAIKFTTRGSVDILLTSETRQDKDHWVVFTVKDTGIGIPADKLPTIFDAFTQADSDMNIQAGGTGLGLAICKRLVQLMGGTIQISSSQGNGTSTSFQVHLPPAGNEHSSTPESLPVAASPPTIRPLRMLLAEDMEDNRQLVQLFLHDTPIKLDVATDGVEAVRMCASTRYDLVLMDIRMPNMDGMEATRRIRELEARNGHPRVPILALSAHAFNEFRDACLDAGCTQFLTKPISRERLLETISKLT
ncbi:MAG: response regulator, partial [Proteobacteria bacterium]|nr:response regulator [Pseudomonadota bacterium]MBU1611344.1 response regulator [Pseudomonadota bacterium]